jgi:hypothetical protein
VEAGGDDLLGSCIWKHIAGELFDRELIEGFVGVERADDVVAVWPDGAVAVFFVTVGVGVAGKVEPTSCPPLAVARRFQKVVYDLSESLGSGACGEGVGDFDGGRESDQVEMNPADEGVGIGLFGERSFIEMINRVGVGGDRRFFGMNKGPVFLEMSPFFDPTLDEIDFGGLQNLVRLGGRHDVVGVRGDDTGDGLFPVLIAGDIKPQSGFAKRFSLFVFGVIRAVAFKAIGGQDGADLFRK